MYGGAKVVGAGVVAAELVTHADSVDKRFDIVVRRNGQLLKTKIQANASGRPGPNAPTGDYRRSWNLRVSKEGGFIVATVGTNRPQARRLEYGFHGVDSLGRHYNQPPYAHVGPAMDWIEPRFFAEMEAVIDFI